MSISKAWDWKQENNAIWRKPCEESYYIAERWKVQQQKAILDFGCGLGRHSIYFAKQCFSVSAFDLSEEGVSSLREWAKDENVNIHTTICDMLKLPYADNSFDGIFAYNVISHTDTNGMKTILAEIKRILKPGGEIFLSLCSKETWTFKDSGYPKIDDNTVVKTDDGPEKGIPHFCVNLDDIVRLFHEFSVISVRHVDDCYFEGRKCNSKHYFILAKNTAAEPV